MPLDPQTGVRVCHFIVDRLEERRREQSARACAKTARLAGDSLEAVVEAAQTASHRKLNAARPIHQGLTSASEPVWMISRYAEAREALTDPLAPPSVVGVGSAGSDVRSGGRRPRSGGGFQWHYGRV